MPSTEIKTCRKCGNELSLDEFYTHPRMADGHLNTCKSCTRQRVTEHRDKNSERIQRYDRVRGRTSERIAQRKATDVRYRLDGRRAQTISQWGKRNREKTRAHCILHRAIWKGQIVRQNCWCGAPGEAHHEDYSKPLEVIWECRKHHAKRHRKD